MKNFSAARAARFALQTVSLAAFLLLFTRLSYPLGPDGQLLQWFSRLDPWLLFSQLRWQQALPSWLWLPLATLVVTLLWGRVFCGWLCPFGALLALAARLGRPVAGSKAVAAVRVRLLRVLSPWRYYWLLLLFVVLLLGSNWGLFLTPFALFSHEIVSVLQGSLPWLLIGLVAVTVLFSRIWCSMLCPTGVLLSAVARLRLGGYQLAGGCSRCGQCTRHCPVGATPAARGIAGEGCLACGTCQRVCPPQAIKWQWLGRQREQAAPVAAGAGSRQPSRRQFFKAAAAVALAAAVWKDVAWAAGKTLRPPGALPEGEFTAVCNRCGRCIQVCPSKALTPMPFAAGLGNFATPQIIPRQNRCDLCLICPEVCPTGAITKVPLDQVRIGRAVVDQKRCLAWTEEKLCFLCGEQCPVQAVVGDERRRPTVAAEKCVGCGGCENGCPVEGEAAIRVFPL